MKPTRAEQAVKNGVALLDEKHPGWREKISVDDLDMVHPNRCILGQLYGHYSNGTEKLNLSTEPEEYGFNAYPGFRSAEDYRRLTKLWLSEFGFSITSANSYLNDILSKCIEEEQELTEEVRELKQQLKILKSRRKDVRKTIEKLNN